MLYFSTNIISLQSASIERKKNISIQMKKLGFTYEIMHGVDGKSLDMDTDSRIHSEGNWLRPGQVGCALGHLNCYEKAKKENIKHLLIFEDDFKVTHNFSGDIHLISDWMPENSVCLFHATTFPNEVLTLDSTKCLVLPSGMKVYRLMSGRPLCTTAYLIDQTAYSSLLKNQLPVKTVADDWPRFLNNQWIKNLYIAEPSPIGTQYFPSQIGYGQGAGRAQKIASTFIKLQIPILRQIAVAFLDYRDRKSHKRVIV